MTRRQDATKDITPDVDQTRAAPSRMWPIHAGLLVSVFGARLLGIFIRHVYDDAFITFRYARNLADGIGFVYNAGEQVLGTTSPLFGLLLVPFTLLRTPLEVAVPLLNSLLDCATVFLLLRWAERRREILPCVLAAVLVAGDPHMVRIAVGGMETSLFLLVSVGALLLYDGGRPVAAVMLSAVSCFVRPEGVLLTLLLIAASAAARDWGSALRGAVAAVAIIGLPELALWRIYGSPLPRSVVAKAGAVNGSLLLVLKEQFALNPLHLLILPLSGLGAATALRRQQLLRLAGLWAAAYALVYVVARPFIWGWYFFPLHFVKFLLAGFGGAWLVERTRGLRRVSPMSWALAGALLVLASGAAVAFRTGAAPVRRDVYDRMRVWCEQHDAARFSFCAGDIGAIGYYSGGYIYDLAGLIATEAHSRVADHVGFVATWKPDYLLLVADRSQTGIARAPTLHGQYRPVERFSREGRRTLEPVGDELLTSWTQDYILYERVDLGSTRQPDMQPVNPVR